MRDVERRTPPLHSPAFARLLEAIRAMTTAQAAGDVAAVMTMRPVLAATMNTVGGLVRAALGGDDVSGHPAGPTQAVLLARDVDVVSRHAVTGLRRMLLETVADRNTAAGSVCSGQWWEPALSMPRGVRDRVPHALAFGAGALSRRAGLSRTGSGELLWSGEPGEALDMVCAVAWLSVLVDEQHLVVATFTTGDTAWLSALCDEMER